MSAPIGAGIAAGNHELAVRQKTPSGIPFQLVGTRHFQDCPASHIDAMRRNDPNFPTVNREDP